MKQKPLISLAIIVGVSMLMISVTLALFTSETAVEGNTLAAGKLELTIGNPEIRDFAIGNLYPGQELTLSEIEITNSGTLPYYLKAVISETSAATGPGGGYLPAAVNITADLSGSGETTAYGATLADLLGKDLIWQENEKFLVIEPGKTVSFRLDGQFDLSAGNEYQKSAWEGKITFTAVQADGQGPAAESITWAGETGTPGDQGEAVSEEPEPINDPSDNSSFSDSTIMDIFKEAMARSAIKYEDFMSKDPVHNVGTPPYEEYNINSWNGYLEKLLEAGDVESNLRLTNTSPHYGKNTIGYENPFSENVHKKAVVNLLNRGIFNYLRNNNPYKTMIPLAMIITRDSFFDHSRADDSFIRNNLDVLTGTMVLYKPDNRPNDEVQVYYIKEDGSKSELVFITEILPLSQ